MSTFTAGDTAPTFTATLTTDGAAANLTGATVVLHFATPAGAFTVTATVVSPTAGTISYAWSGTDLTDARVGVWQWEAQVTFSNGKVQTFPGGSFRVAAQLA